MTKKSDKVNHNTLNEKATRKKLLLDAQVRFGPEGARQLQMMFNKYDKLLKNCQNESERQHIKKIAAADVYQALGYRGGLQVGGEIVIPDDEDDKYTI